VTILTDVDVRSNYTPSFFLSKLCIQPLISVFVDKVHRRNGRNVPLRNIPGIQGLTLLEPS